MSLDSSVPLYIKLEVLHSILLQDQIHLSPELILLQFLEETR